LKLNGASITVVVNGVTTYPALYYTSPTQLAAVLPAATPVGTGTLTVLFACAAPTFHEAEASASHRASILMTTVEAPHAGLP